MRASRSRERATGPNPCCHAERAVRSSASALSGANPSRAALSAAQAKQRSITPEAVVKNVMMGTSRIKEMMSPIEAANLIIFGLSRHAKYLIGGDLLFDGGMVLTY